MKWIYEMKCQTRRIIVPLLLIAFFFVINPLPAEADTSSYVSLDPGRFKQSYVPGEVLVRFSNSVDTESARSIHGLLSTTLVEKIPGRIERVRIRKGMTVEETVLEYSNARGVTGAQPNYIYHLEATPNDAAFYQQWGLHNTGQSVNGSAGIVDADIDAPEAWNMVTGSGSVIIAVIDTGIDYNHPDLSGNIWRNPGESVCFDGVDNDGNGYIDDCRGWDFLDDDNDPADMNGHGTHVAGILGAVGNNSHGVAGVNWSSQLMALRAGGITGTFTTATIVAAIDYAVSNGARVINASFGGAIYDQLQYEAIKAAADSGVLFVAAAGNEGMNTDSEPHYPSGYYLPNIISVAATDQSDQLAGFSNYGPTSVDVGAPGTSIFSTVPLLGYHSPILVYENSFDTDTFGQLPNNWKSSGRHNTWAVDLEASFSSPSSLADSPGADYQNDTDSYAWLSNPIQTVKNNLYTLSFKVRAELESSFDWLGFAASGDQSNWSIMATRTGSTGTGFVTDSVDYTFAADILNSYFLGFWLFSDYSITGDGIYLDDLQMLRYPIFINNHSYDHLQGTSMAVPYVAGLAALIWSDRPQLEPADVKDLILANADRLESLLRQGIPLSSFSTPGSWPAGLAFDGTDLWNADYFNDMIYRLNSSGTVLAAFHSPAPSPGGLTFDGVHLWCVTPDGIYKMDRSGTVLSSVASPARWPYGLAFDGSHLWVADAFDGTLYRITTSGTLVSSISAPGPWPSGLTFADNHLWSADYSDQMIYQMDISGIVVSSYHTPGVSPYGLTHDGEYLWNADSSDNRIYKISPTSGYLVASEGRINAFKSVNASPTVLPIPSLKNIWTYSPVVSPVSGVSPPVSKPVGMGSIAMGGDSIGLQVGLNRFSGPVDIYGAYTVSTDPGTILVLNPDGLTFTAHSYSVIEAALSSGTVPAGVRPWKAGISGSLHEHLFDQPATSLLPGTYTAYLLVSPADSLSVYYLWITSFVIP